MTIDIRKYIPTTQLEKVAGNITMYKKKNNMNIKNLLILLKIGQNCNKGKNACYLICLSTGL